MKNDVYLKFRYFIRQYNNDHVPIDVATRQRVSNAESYKVCAHAFQEIYGLSDKRLRALKYELKFGQRKSVEINDNSRVPLETVQKLRSNDPGVLIFNEDGYVQYHIYMLNYDDSYKL